MFSKFRDQQLRFFHGGYGGNHHYWQRAAIANSIPGAAGKLLRAGCSRGWETRHVSDHYQPRDVILGSSSQLVGS